MTHYATNIGYHLLVEPISEPWLSINRLAL